MLRRKICEHLDREVIKDPGEDEIARKQRALPPSILAQAVPHVRRLRPTGAGGVLKLLRGGSQIVFLDARALPPKVGEVKCTTNSHVDWHVVVGVVGLGSTSVEFAVALELYCGC